MLEIVFLTSNRVKFEHLSFLTRSVNIELLVPPDYGKPYNEPRIGDREKLLKESIESANERLYKKTIEDQINASKSLPSFREKTLTRRELAKRRQDKFFIIEDTSVIIDALSNDEEVPGVDVKYWMRDMTFEALDELLRAHGNNRNVAVRSDIVLYIPYKLRDNPEDVYKIFTGTERGSVAGIKPEVETNPLYPWLDDKTFNKWFVPSGADDVLSSLDIDRATRHDFRAKAVSQLVSFLSEKNLLENSRTHEYESIEFQISLFQDDSFIVCGPTCSGKSTVAEYMAKEYGYFHVEASDFMHWLFYKRSPKGAQVHDVHKFAKRVLEKEPEAVAGAVKGFLSRFGINRYIISGFRTPKELRPFKNEIDKGAVKLIYLDAKQNLRFERNICRDRPDAVSSFVEFRERDRLQQSMGLSDFSKLNSSEKVENNGSLSDLHNKFSAQFLSESLAVPLSYEIPDQFDLESNLEDCILLVLYSERLSLEYYTTTKISSMINKKINRVRSGKNISAHKDNVSRYFNMSLHPYYRIKRESGKNMYRLSATGMARARQLIVKHGVD